MLVVGRQQFGFGINTAPAVRQRQVDRRLEVNARGFRHVAVGVDEVHRLTIEMGIERTDIVLVIVHVQLRLSGVGVARLTVEDLELFR